MKQTRLLLLTLLLLVGSVSHRIYADGYEVDGYVYVKNGKSSVEIVKAPSVYNLKGAVTVPSKVVISGKTYTVTSIGDEAFEGRYYMTSVTIPSTIQSIGDEAFKGCSYYNTDKGGSDGLSKVIFDGVSNLKSIGANAFNGCGNLKSISLPSSVNYIGEYAFYYCQKLSSKIVIPSGVKKIEWNTFRFCSELTTVVIPSSVDSIMTGAFGNCEKLSSATIPVGVKYIGMSAFAQTALEDVVIPEGVTYIGDCAFYRCENLRSVSIPSTIKIRELYENCFEYETGYNAFQSCDNLVDVISHIKNPVAGPNNNSFDNSHYRSATLHVPPHNKQQYEDHYWHFKNIVEDCDGNLGKVTLNKSKATIEKGKTMTIKATVSKKTLSYVNVKWKSSNTKVATVTSSGKVKGIKAGTATITCTSSTGLSAKCKVTVGYVKLDKSEAVIKKGKTKTLTATVYPSSLEDKSVTWKSSNTKVATVTSKGKVKGVKAGTATITCTSNATGLSTTCKVTVGYVKLDQTEVTVKKGKTVTLTPTVYPSSLEDKSVTWKSSNTKIATVTSKGKVKGIKAGTAIITCTSVATGLSTTCTVTVTATSGSRSVDGDDDDTTGIETIEEAPALAEPYDVYDLSGRKVRHQVNSLDGLPDGVYIVNGRKVLKK